MVRGGAGGHGDAGGRQACSPESLDRHRQVGGPKSEGVQVKDPEVIRAIDRAYHAEGGIAISSATSLLTARW